VNRRFNFLNGALALRKLIRAGPAVRDSPRGEPSRARPVVLPAMHFAPKAGIFIRPALGTELVDMRSGDAVAQGSPRIAKPGLFKLRFYRLAVDENATSSHLESLDSYRIGGQIHSHCIDPEQAAGRPGNAWHSPERTIKTPERRGKN
jgi:hypothetical protein